jgi:phosphoribosylaminoimidazolecarboxamide formyltransferase/IMP cyclohydrolase
MLRSAAKNHDSVTVVVDPADYSIVAEQITQTGGTTLELRRRLAARVYARTSEYDGQIAAYMARTFQTDTAKSTSLPTPGSNEPWPATLRLSLPHVQALRYGENPHQHAALYGNFAEFFTQLHGKELSYNNILDLTAAASLIGEFADDAPTLAILKHTNPCGVGQGTSLREAWDKAFATDRQAPYGGIIAVNRPLDLPCAQAIADIFSEVIIAPGFDADALALLEKKKNLRLLVINKPMSKSNPWEFRGVGAGSLLVQERDQKSVKASELQIPTKRKPSPEELRAMLFGWRIVKHVKSNAIIYVANDRTLGVGAGQMSRVDASRIAVWKAGEAGLSLKGSVVCSDAFFPFADGLIAAAEAGATAAIQPGGSVRDSEVIAAADARGLAMAFAGIRHFRH